MTLYQLSKLIPVPMRSRYGLVQPDGSVTRHRVRWVQWRDRIWWNRVTDVAT